MQQTDKPMHDESSQKQHIKQAKKKADWLPSLFTLSVPRNQNNRNKLVYVVHQLVIAFQEQQLVSFTFNKRGCQAACKWLDFSHFTSISCSKIVKDKITSRICINFFRNFITRFRLCLRIRVRYISPWMRTMNRTKQRDFRRAKNPWGRNVLWIMHGCRRRWAFRGGSRFRRRGRGRSRRFLCGERRVWTGKRSRERMLLLLAFFALFFFFFSFSTITAATKEPRWENQNEECGKDGWRDGQRPNQLSEAFWCALAGWDQRQKTRIWSKMKDKVKWGRTNEAQKAMNETNHRNRKRERKIAGKMTKERRSCSDN